MDQPPILFIPGPTEVDLELRQIMARPLIGHRDSHFVATVQDVCSRLQQAYGAAHAAFETCPATALMEAAVRNLVPRGARCLHLVCGAFSERWQQIAQWCGRDAIAHAVPLGCAHDPSELKQQLAAMPAVQAVMITHNETSTGVIEPLRELAAAVHAAQPDALVCADVVTSFVGAELHVDAWGLDLAFAGTQKCLALPPGLTTYAISERALQRAAHISERGFLFDLPRAVADTQKGQTLATPCVPLVFALQRQLQRISQEGLPARWQRHAQLRDATLQWASQQGFAPFVAASAARSPTVSCIDAKGANVDALSQRANRAGFTLDKGYGKLKGKAFRIGHMGDHSQARLQQLLQALAQE